MLHYRFLEMNGKLGRLQKTSRTKQKYQNPNQMMKKKIISKGPFHAAPKAFQKAALFLRLGLPSTLIRHERGAFPKPSLQTGRIWKRWFFVLVWTENILWIELFKNNDYTLILTEFPSTQIQMTGYCCVFKFLRCSVDGNVFRLKPPLRSVDRPWDFQRMNKM